MNAELYGLNAHPFPLKPAAGSYFQSVAHSKALAFVGDHLGKAGEVIAITGESGSGKSMLAEHLLQTIDRHQVLTVRIDAAPGSTGALYHELAKALGLTGSGEGEAGWRALIEQFLKAEGSCEAHDKSHVLLVIDDAHHLSPDDLASLQHLSAFQLQVLLLGEPELCCRLTAACPLQKEHLPLHSLGCLDPLEVRDFIEHRLLCFGWSGDYPSIDPRVFPEIARASEGLPGKVNQICHELWEYSTVHGLGRIDLPFVRDILAHPQGTAATFAMHEELIGELQKAVVELAELQKRRVNHPGRIDRSLNAELLPRILDRLSALEAQALEQEQALKHILTMLIDWIENGGQRVAA